MSLFPPIFESNHLLVLNKPANLLTQPNRVEKEEKGQKSLEDYAKEWIKEKKNKPGQVFLEASHRLDKPVSGVVVFGKTTKALQRLNESFRLKETKKVYLAWVEGEVKQKQGFVENYLIHEEFKAKIVSSFHFQAKFARLSYLVLEQSTFCSLLEITLETGRYHQIRVQLAGLGHPVIGDVKYGSKIPFKSEKIALHHHRLEIPDPVSKKIHCFEAPLPDYFIKQ